MERIPVKPVKKQKGPQWATYCEMRSPKFKIYDNRGNAKQALSYKFPHTHIALYELRGEEWVPVLDLDPEKFVCAHCGQTGRDGDQWWECSYTAKPSFTAAVIHYRHIRSREIDCNSYKEQTVPIETFFLEEDFKYE